jgi:hypothetical protein
MGMGALAGWELPSLVFASRQEVQAAADPAGRRGNSTMNSTANFGEKAMNARACSGD